MPKYINLIMKNLHKIKKYLINPVVTLGTFDGVHIGHKALLERVVERTKALNGISIVITYHPHPIEILKKKVYPFLLTEKIKKEQFMKAIGIDYVLWLDFDVNLAHLTPGEFVKEYLHDQIGAKEIIVGYDWHFGKNRAGDYHLLKKMERELDFHVEMVDEVLIDGEIVSSTAIRKYLSEGNIQRANIMLERNYCIMGTVEKGEQLGTGFGYPTINLKPIEIRKLYPAIGVYITQVKYAHNMFWGLTNVGTRPTIDKNNRQKNIETHILDFNEHIYEQKFELFFIQKIRNEIEFKSIDDLIEQIKKDEIYARNIIEKLNNE